MDNSDFFQQDKYIEDLHDKIDDKNEQIEKLYEELSVLNEDNKLLRDKLLKMRNKKDIQNEIDEKDLYYFYIISNGHENRFKIGITGNLKSRMSSIQTCNHEEIKIINFLVGEKETIIKLEASLKEIMKDYNVHGEWFELSFKDKLDFFDYINRLKFENFDLNKLTSFVKNKQSSKKLSELSVLDLIEILKDNNFYKKNNKLVYFIKETNQLVDDYLYFFDTNNVIENDVSQTKFKQIFKRLNQDFLLNKFDEFFYCPDDFLDNSLNEFISTFKFGINNLIGISLDIFYRDYSEFCENHNLKKLSKEDFAKKLQSKDFGFSVMNYDSIFGTKEKRLLLFNCREIELSNKILSFLNSKLGIDINKKSVFITQEDKFDTDFIQNDLNKDFNYKEFFNGDDE